MNDPKGQKLNVENKFGRKDGPSRPGMNGQSMDSRGRNNAPGSGMNRNASGGRSDRRDRDDRQPGGGGQRFNRSERGSLGPRNSNANAPAGTTYANARR